jgi:dihydroceramide fatty acyl 2-hydroxylase
MPPCAEQLPAKLSKADLGIKNADPHTNIPLLQQVAEMGDKYQEWVHKPHFFGKSLPLFNKDGGFLEFNSHTKWYMVPIAWFPIIIYELYKAYTYSSISYWMWPILLLIGHLLWGFVEYALHCWAFHHHTSTPIMNQIHFIIHGIHHFAPQDPDRLVFPPLPGILFIYIPLRIIVSCLVTNPTAFYLLMGGGAFGYLVYDMTHFYLHHGKKFSGLLAYLKRCHNHHHFFPHGEQHNFGISPAGKIVDFLMGTNYTPPPLTSGDKSQT